MDKNETSGIDTWMWFNWTQVNDDDVIIITTATGANSSSSGNESGVDNIFVDWDDWDRSLWTPEQRQLLERGAIPRHVHITLGILLALIVLFGVAANSTILYVFSRYTFFINFYHQLQSEELCF